MAYDMHKSETSKILSRMSSKLSYGTANAQGFIWQDEACLNPITSLAQAKDNKCSPFQFVALYLADGLEENTDGILGLSPHKDDEKRKLHYLWALKDSGMISKAVVAFSLASLDMKDQPYATFGGINAAQIVGGKEGLSTFKSFDNFLGTWALEGNGIKYAGKLLDLTDISFPAIIDTGTSQMSLPPRIFGPLQDQWNEAVPGGIDCKSDPSFCTTDKPCQLVAPLLKPVGFVLSGQTFTLEPMQYLF